MEIRTGYLEVRTGAMNGAKTTWLENILAVFQNAPLIRGGDPIKCLMIVPAKDMDRSSEEGVQATGGSTTKNPLLKSEKPFPVLRVPTSLIEVSTEFGKLLQQIPEELRDGVRKNSQLRETVEQEQFLLMPYFEKLKQYTVLAFDEGNFWQDLPEVVEILVKQYGKRIYVCGLTGDSDQNLFGRLLEIFPMADFFAQLTGKCSMCFQDGRIVDGPFTACLRHKNSQILVGNSCYVTVCRKHYDQIDLLLTQCGESPTVL